MEWAPYTSVKHPRLNGVFPPFGGVIEKFLDAATQAGFIVECFQGLRTIEQQDALYAQGRTKPGNVVTNAKGGQSYHNWGLAADLVFKVNGQWSWDGKLPWGKLGALGVSFGLEWGGNWVKFPDLPHYQITYGTTIGNLYNSYLGAKASATQDGVPFDSQALLLTTWSGLKV